MVTDDYQKGVNDVARRGDNIHKRKDGRWEGRYKCGYREDGSTKYASVYAASYTECKKKLILMQTNAGKTAERKEDNRLFRDVLDAWIATNRVHLKGATEAKYVRLIETHIAPELGGMKLDQLNAGVINSFLNAKMQAGGLPNKEPLSASYVRTMAVIVESALRYAAAEGWCAPLKTPIYKPVVFKKDIQVLSNRTMEKLTRCLSDDHSPTAIGVLLALFGGLRIGEVCALQWQDIDLASNVLHIRHTIARVPGGDPKQKTQLILDTPKTAASIRDVPIPSFLRNALQLAYKNQRSAFVVSYSNQFVSTRTFDYRYRKWLKQSGIPIFSFHTLRHTYATRCAESGMDAKTLSRLLGHSSSIISLNVYVHPSLDVAADLLERIYDTA